VAAVLVVAVPAIASPANPEGVPLFGMDLRYSGAVTVGQPVRLLVAMSGLTGTRISGTIALPAGVELVSGDLNRSTVANPSVEQWEIVVRPTRKGAHRIVATFVGVVGARWRDEGDFVLVLEAPAPADGAVSRRTRSEKIVGGRRYRYGGEYLVPIEGPEGFNQNDILMRGRRARTISTTAAWCDACGPDSPQEVTFVVFTDKDGRLVDVRAVGSRPPDAPAVLAARKALAQWTFAPARLAGRSVADWQSVKVTVNRPPRR